MQIYIHKIHIYIYEGRIIFKYDICSPLSFVVTKIYQFTQQIIKQWKKHNIERTISMVSVIILFRLFFFLKKKKINYNLVRASIFMGRTFHIVSGMIIYSTYFRCAFIKSSTLLIDCIYIFDFIITHVWYSSKNIVYNWS